MKTFPIHCLGYDIQADLHEGSRTDEVILFLIGSNSSRARKKDFVAGIVEKTGIPTLIIDYSGHGDSPFKLEDIRPAQHLLEAITAYDWIAQHHPQARISIIASSYGAYLAAHLIAFRPVHKLVLTVPAIYRQETFYDAWGHRMQDEQTYRKQSDVYRRDISAMKAHPIFAQNAKNFTGRTLVVVHSDDELIPKEVTDVFTEAFSADHYIAQGFKHAVSHSNPTQQQMEAYQSAIAEWLVK